MTLIERITSIANKVDVNLTGSTVSELLKSLDEGLDGKKTTKKESFYKAPDQKKDGRVKKPFSED